MRFDIDVGNSVGGPTQQTIQKFAVEASLDGKKWWFWGAYQCATLASKAAIEVGGSVFYNRAAA